MIETIAYFALGIVALIVAVRIVRPRKVNRYVGHKSRPGIHVPRETSWSRAAKYYEKQREESLKYLAQHPNEKPF